MPHATASTGASALVTTVRGDRRSPKRSAFAEATRHQRAPRAPRQGARRAVFQPPVLPAANAPIQPRGARAQAPSTSGCRTARPSATRRPRLERPGVTSRRAPRPSSSGFPLRAARRCPAARSTRRERPRPIAARTAAPRRRTRGAILRPPRERSDETSGSRQSTCHVDPRHSMLPDVAWRTRIPRRCTRHEIAVVPHPEQRFQHPDRGDLGARPSPAGAPAKRSPAAGQATAPALPRRRDGALEPGRATLSASAAISRSPVARPPVRGTTLTAVARPRQQDLLARRPPDARARLEAASLSAPAWRRPPARAGSRSPAARASRSARVQRAALKVGDDDDLAPRRRRRGKPRDRLQHARPELRTRRSVSRRPFPAPQPSRASAAADGGRGRHAVADVDDNGPRDPRIPRASRRRRDQKRLRERDDRHGHDRQPQQEQRQV